MKVITIVVIVLSLSMVIGILPIGKVYAVSDVPYNHPINGADTCNPSGLETWGLVGSANDTFQYGFGFINHAIGEFSSDFTGLLVTSISFYMCGYKNDTIADANQVKIGIYNQADGSLRQLIGSVSFDSLPTCHLNQDGTLGGGNCASQHPSLITVTGSYKVQDAHSPGGVDYIGVSFPTDSVKGHDVLIFCANNCSATVVSHGGICDPYLANLQCGPTGGVNSPGSGMAGTLIFQNPPATSLCNQGYSGAIVGAEGIIVVLSIMMAQSLGSLFGRSTNRQMKLFMQIILAVGFAIFISVLILGQLPANVGAGC